MAVDTTGLPKALSRIRLDNPFLGRIRIYTDVRTVTPDNVQDIVSRAFVTHLQNAERIWYLWNYYRGEQPIKQRVKEVRPEICNRIVENRAQEIVSFKTSYLISEPMQYIANGSEDGLTDKINDLNGYMRAEAKSALDKELVDWMHITGIGYRLVLANPQHDNDNPFKIYIPEPWHTFVVYNSFLTHEPVLGVQYLVDENAQVHYSCWSNNALYEWVGDHGEVTVSPHSYGQVPLIEYPANTARLGAFEIVLDLLDAINGVDSDRADGIEQFIQSLVKFINCDVDEKTFEAMKALGAVKVKSRDGNKADIDFMSQELNQSETQTYKNDLYNAVLTICGMPNRNGGMSTSDTGAAVSMRDGWSNAEARAKDTELCFKRSEERFLRLVLRICKQVTGLDVSLNQIEMKFTRYNFADILSKSQVLTTMLSSPKIHPELAFRACGLFIDPEAAYTKSDEYYQEQVEKAMEQSQAMMTGGSESDGGYDAAVGRNGWVAKKRPMGNSGSSTKGASSGNQG